MNKTILVFGTRPELIKLFPIISEFKKRGLRDRLIVINSNQHYSLLDQLIDLFEVDIDYNLNINNTSNNLSILTSEIIKELEIAIQQIELNNHVNAIIVQGDTSTTFCSSIVAFYHKIDIHYVEAGLRTDDISKPFPEEFHRRVISHAAKFLYAPTKSARNNLINEGFFSDQIIVTGNTIIDTIQLMEANFEPQIESNENNLVLCTMHRRENHGNKFVSFYESLVSLAKDYPTYNFKLIKHPNPEVQKVIDSSSIQLPENLTISNPIPYPKMIDLLQNSCLIITDSGGLQEEASYFLKPMIVLRDSTERIESIKSGIAICHSGEYSLEKPFLKMKDLIIDDCNKYLYGSGKAAEMIVDKILRPIESTAPPELTDGVRLSHHPR